MQSNYSHIVTAETVAILPAPILWAAAQFASADLSRPAISRIQIERTQWNVKIRSVDGHRAFRATLDTSGAEPDMAYWPVPDQQLLLPAADWLKPGKLLTADWAHLKPDGTAHIINHAGATVEIRQWSNAENLEQFPNVDQVWPTEFECEPMAPINLNANYLESIAKVAARLSGKKSQQIQVETGNECSPLQFSSHYRDTDQRLEYLLMPVQARHTSGRLAERIERQRQKESDARELAAFRARELAQLPTISRELAHV